jgi:hypothetical protein
MSFQDFRQRFSIVFDTFRFSQSHTFSAIEDSMP